MGNAVRAQKVARNPYTDPVARKVFGFIAARPYQHLVATLSSNKKQHFLFCRVDSNREAGQLLNGRNWIEDSMLPCSTATGSQRVWINLLDVQKVKCFTAPDELDLTENRPASVRKISPESRLLDYRAVFFDAYRSEVDSFWLKAYNKHDALAMAREVRNLAGIECNLTTVTIRFDQRSLEPAMTESEMIYFK